MAGSSGRVPLSLNQRLKNAEEEASLKRRRIELGLDAPNSMHSGGKWRGQGAGSSGSGGTAGSVVSSSTSATSTNAAGQDFSDLKSLLAIQNSNQKDLMATASTYREKEKNQDYAHEIGSQNNQGSWQSRLGWEGMQQDLTRGSQQIEGQSRLNREQHHHTLAENQQRFGFESSLSDQDFRQRGQLQAQGSREEIAEEANRTDQQLRRTHDDRRAASNLWRNG